MRGFVRIHSSILEFQPRLEVEFMFLNNKSQVDVNNKIFSCGPNGSRTRKLQVAAGIQDRLWAHAKNNARHCCPQTKHAKRAIKF